MYTVPPPVYQSSQVYAVSGDVSIDESAAIAPGVILQADPNSRIIISRGVCIGMGCILHARDGTLEIEPGAILGTGVLIIGRGKIGENACIGSASTIFNASITRSQMLPAGSLIGDTSRPITGQFESLSDTPTPDHILESQELQIEEITPSEEPSAEMLTEEPLPESSPSLEDPWGESATEEKQEKQEKQETPQGLSWDSENTLNGKNSQLPEKRPASEFTDSPTILYGQTQISQLLTTLFPHRKTLNPEDTQN
jgi:carbon dioxide concentrating mechanism protein CcmN